MAGHDEADVPGLEAWLERRRLDLPAVRREQIVGLEHALTAAEALVWTIVHPDPGAGIAPPRGVLLHGDPGTGKTLMARYIVTLLRDHDPDLPAYSVAAGDLTPERIRGILALLDARPGRSLLVLDELDHWIGRDTSWGDRALSDLDRARRTALLAALDGIGVERRAMVVMTTNMSLDDIHRPLVRSGRIGTKIACEPPEASEVARLFRMQLAGAPGADALDIDFLAEAGSRRAPAEIVGAIGQALAICRMQGRPITLADLARLLAETGVVVPRASSEPRDAEFIHEWGHATATSVLLGPERVRALAFMNAEHAETRTELDREPDERVLLSRLVSLMAGRAAEEMFGPAGMGSTSDMDQARGLLDGLHRNGRWPTLVGMPEHGPVAQAALQDLHAAQAALLAWADRAARILVTANRDHAEGFLERFRGRRIITGGQWRAFLEERPLTVPTIPDAPGVALSPTA